jgi:undecaprenyl-diphosphatase
VENLLQVILLGIIEGITEFLPISSTGHLLIAQHWLGARSELFTVAIQAGAILAVIAIYWQRLWQLTLNLSQPANRSYLFKLLTAFVITVIGGFAAKAMGLELPENVAPVAWAMVIGGAAIFLIEAYTAQKPLNDEVTWRVAHWVGIAQIVAAVFPGTSRSAATLFAATAFEVLNLYRHDRIAQENWTDLGVGFVVSAIVAFIAVKWLLNYIQTHKFTVFAWYRIIAGVALLALVR